MYRSVASEDHRGTRLADEDHHPPTKPPRFGMLDDEPYLLLLHTLNRKFRTTGYSPNGALPVTRRVEQLEKISIRGVVYAHEKSLPRDSNVLFRRLGGTSSRVGRIWLIFRLQYPTPGGETEEETYVLVREYLPISDSMMQSQYTQFGFAGGFLCHSEKWNGFHVIGLTDIICHLAKTPIHCGSEKTMHFLPLNKVRV